MGYLRPTICCHLFKCLKTWWPYQKETSHVPITTKIFPNINILNVKAPNGVPESNPLLTIVYISKDLVTHSKETSLMPILALIFIVLNIFILQAPKG